MTRRRDGHSDRVLSITPGADEALTLLRDTVEDLPEGGGVRITHEQDEDGEAGFALQLVGAAEDGDVVIDGHPLQVFVEPSAAAALEESALDGEAHGDHVHFGFVDREDAGTDVLDA
jgi:Fe-S cluster assembly iron-binding protein IscA